MEVLNNTPPPEVENMEVLNETPPPQAQNMEVLNDTPPPQVQNMEVHNGTHISTSETGDSMDGRGTPINSDISKEYVVSKTARQVGSHAQKFFSRINCKIPIERRRASINDIRTITSNPMTPIIVPMDHQVNSDIPTHHINNHQIASFLPPESYPYTFGVPYLNNNPNNKNPNGNNFEILNQVEASKNNMFAMEQKPNNNNYGRFNQVEAYDNNSLKQMATTVMEQNPNNNNLGRFNQVEAYGNNLFNPNNNNFGRFNHAKAYDNNSFDMEQNPHNNNNLLMPMSRHPFISMYLPSPLMNNGGH
ncbi:hypothetical protein H5410_008343 [Solanum commersonii]|uniref:Uncharacterized protein n=1 Tax=Solanum commersonii TaxID=4109 RepID=A0A9J6AEP3_SOLCO|nr:hypothetical protein H5410_008343 [Solanum commersonii]